MIALELNLPEWMLPTPTRISAQAAGTAVKVGMGTVSIQSSWKVQEEAPLPLIAWGIFCSVRI